jgi:hypothetical protein
MKPTLGVRVGLAKQKGVKILDPIRWCLIVASTGYVKARRWVK